MGPGPVRSFCHICAPYCGVLVEVDGERVESVRGDPAHPISRGYTCPKGRALGEMHHDPRRLDRPALREQEGLVDCSWEEVLDDLAQRLRDIVSSSGPDAVAVYQGTPALHETVAQPALAKLFHKLGSRSRYSSLTVDIAAKLTVTPMVLGAQLLPVVDFDDTRLLIVLGTNPVVSHGQYNGISDPVRRLRQVARQGELWVIDPRRTETAAQATRYVSIRPGTDHALMAFLVRSILRRGIKDAVADRLDGVEQLRRAVEPWDATAATATTGIPTATLEELSDAIGRAGRFSLLTGTGVTTAPSANATEWLALAALLLTDSFDRVGGMWCNPGHTFRRDRAPIAPASRNDQRTGPDSRPDLPRFLAEQPCAALADEIETGNVRALISFGGNPLISIAEPDRLRSAIAGLDVFAVIGTMRDPQTALATHVLPAAGGLERAEVLLTSESAQLKVLAQYAPAVVPPAALRRPSWWIIGQLARRFGLEVLPGRLDVETATDDELLSEMVGGHRVLEEMRAADGPLLAEDRVTNWVIDALPIERPRLAPPPLVEQLARLGHAGRDDDRLLLVPRRRLRNFNSLAPLTGRIDEQEILVHVATAAAAGVGPGDTVRVTSEHGELVGQLAVTEHIDRGVVAISHGYAEVHVGQLTSTRTGVDPLSGQIAQTAIPVTLSPA